MDTVLTLANRILDQCLTVVTNESETHDGSLLCSKNYSDEGATAVDKNGNVWPVSIEILPRSLMAEIFSWLNLTDLFLGRLVSRRWNVDICETSHLLSSSIIQVSTGDESFDILTSSATKWQNLSLTLSSRKLDPALDWIRFRQCLSSLNHLEFRSCKLPWSVFKACVYWSPNLESLSFDRCLLFEEDDREVVPLLLSGENLKDVEATFSERVVYMKEISVEENRSVDNVIQTLHKFVGLRVGQLERLQVLYESTSPTPALTSTIEQASTLHALILTLMYTNKRTLRALHLNLRDDMLNDTFCDHVLDNFQEVILKLEEFQLTPTISDYGPVFEIRSDTPAPMLSFIRFFQRHPTLKTVGFPHFNNPASTPLRRRKLFRSLPKAVVNLVLPGHTYLVPDFLSLLPKLRQLVVGETAGRPFHPNSFRYTPSVCNLIREVGIYSRIHLSSGKLANFSWKFPALTKFELDVFRPVVNDLDLQGIILNCRWLRHLSITGCDLITDFGITGAPLDWCQDVFRLGILYSNPPEICPCKGKYRPMSVLRGLRTLILRGNAKITDVGLNYGVRFVELKNLWIPYCERVTGWGFKQLGSLNPSIEVLGMTSISITNCEALNDLIASHPRITPEHVIVQNVSGPVTSFLAAPSMLTAILGK